MTRLLVGNGGEGVGHHGELRCEVERIDGGCQLRGGGTRPGRG